MWALVLAVVGGVQLARRRKVGVGAACLCLLGFGLYEAFHIQHALAKVTFNGVQIDHVGWGVYAVIVGAFGALLALYRGRSQSVSETLRGWTRKDPGLEL